MKMKFIALASALLVTLVLSGAVQAQSGAAVSFKGLEISTGYEEPGEAYGWMCYAKTTGAFPGSLTMSMNYLGTKAPGMSSYITGGSWTLPVYATTSKLSRLGPIPLESYQGVLFGTVEAGAITWGKDGNATMELKLTVQGGSQGFAGYSGSAVLYGALAYSDKGAPWTGTIYFDFK
jgi:hypothetical protein